MSCLIKKSEQDFSSQDLRIFASLSESRLFQSLGVIDRILTPLGAIDYALGAAYINIARDYARVPWLSIVFGFENYCTSAVGLYSGK